MLAAPVSASTGIVAREQRCVHGCFAKAMFDVPAKLVAHMCFTSPAGAGFVKYFGNQISLHWVASWH